MVDSLLGKSKPRKQNPGEPSHAPGTTTPPPLRRPSRDRLVRSILLGTIAVVFSIYWLGRSFDVDWQELLGYAATSFGFIAVFIGAALLFALLIRVLRGVTGKARRASEEREN